MTAFIGQQRLSEETTWASVQASYTHTCGFLRAWLDPYDDTLAWYYETCPVDAIITQLQSLIVDFTTAAVSALTSIDAPDSDKHIRVLKIIDDISKMCVEWLNDKNTTEEIAQFLQAENRLRTYIVNELITQGAVQ